MANSSNTTKQGLGSPKVSENKKKDIQSKGGHSSTGKFGEVNGPDANDAGREGARKQSRSAKAEGGRNSHSGSGS